MRSPSSSLWRFFVQYPNREQVLRELPKPQNVSGLRESLEVFDDQQLMVAESQDGPFVLVESIDQLYDGASLRITVPRRRIFVSLNGHLKNRPVVWYPGAAAEQIESAVCKACGLPNGTAIELFEEDSTSVVISATIPNDSKFTVVPQYPETAVGSTGGTSRRQPESPRRKRCDLRDTRTATTPTVPRSASVRNAASPPARGTQSLMAGSSSLRARSSTPQINSSGRAISRPNSPTGTSAGEEVAQPSGRVSAPDEHCIHILAGHTGFVLSLCTVGDVLFTGSQDCNVMIWDLNNLQYIGTLTGHRGFVKCMAATLARKMLCSGSQDKTIKIWSLETFSSTKTLTGHVSEVNAVEILEGTDILVSGAEDRSIRVWDLLSLTQVTAIEQAHTSGIFTVIKLDQGNFVSASRDRTMKVWSSSTWQSCKTLAPPHFDCVTGIAVSSQRGRFFSVSRDKSVRRWDARSLESDLQVASAHGDWLSAVSVSPSENAVFTGGKDSVVKVWNPDLHCIDMLQGHRGPISALLSVDQQLFSASHDRTIRVWRMSQYE
mmetsp:Transcript_6262/g.11631  ORF Transcript_6262/g.11631 Transcript_6262/m.11631 type:complete len:548 (+) Transcript_6262:156-1799(+)